MNNKIIGLHPGGVTPRDFVAAIFHQDLAGGFPVFTKTPEDGGGTAQVTGTSDAFKPVLDGKDSGPWHYCVSYCRRVEGIAKRRKQDIVSVAVLVLDDVGTKVKERYLDTLPVPSFRLETSEGNFQWGYILQSPEPDKGKFEALLRKFAENGMTDAGSIDAAHVFRLPGSVKAGGEFAARLSTWRPELKYTIDGLAMSAGIDLMQEDTEFFVRTPDDLEREKRDDAIYEWMVDHNKVYGQKNHEGYMLIECPWSDKHKSAGTTADYLPLGLTENGDRYFHCHHGHCAHRNTNDFMQWCDEQGAPSHNPQLDEFGRTLIADIMRIVEERKSKKPTGQMGSMTMSELRSQARLAPDPTLYLGPFQSGTWGIIAAMPGVGKSMFTSAIARAVSLGLPLGDWKPGSRLLQVGIVDAEMSEKELSDRFPVDTPDTVHFITTDMLERQELDPFSLGRDFDQNELIRICEEKNIDVIVIDNVEYTLEPAENSKHDVWHPSTWKQVFPLQRWAKSTNRLLIFIDHLNKDGKVQGSMAKQRGASFVMKLEADYEEGASLCFMSSFDKLRYILPGKTKAKYRWWLDGDEWQCERQLDIKDQIALLLRDPDTKYTQKQIGEMVGIGQSMVNRYVQQLRADKKAGDELRASVKKSNPRKMEY